MRRSKKGLAGGVVAKPRIARQADKKIARAFGEGTQYRRRDPGIGKVPTQNLGQQQQLFRVAETASGECELIANSQ
jgi:hypothetical protein